MFLLSGAVVGATLAGPTVALAGEFGDVWKFVKSKLSAPGTLNKPGNPVDFTRLKNVPAGFADGVDDTGALGTFTVREAQDVVNGGDSQNSAYALEDVVQYCAAGEIAISASAYFDGDLNGAAQGGSNDQEVWIAGIERIPGVGTDGFRVWGGNDSGTDHTLTVQVLCLAQ